MAGHKRTAGGDMASATTESEVPGMPQKKFYRSRAHCNPPLNPTEMDWSAHYPKLDNPKVNFLDIGCGFGGLTIALANLFPNKTTLAMEIRPKVTEYVRLRIEALRQEHATHLLTEYAYFIPEGGILYTITDVEDLHNWHVAKCDSHPCFERITDDAVLVRRLVVFHGHWN
ncbi:hypothetical protein DYB32_004168 [Aphanomyces invadans]|uniref:tRNA (guanine(46)-N(7))-methyltransferase n=1 Tax=Aphanomyces invadans TaxID=157072 RepID=A0A3R6WMU3_9STRA|nr:hypothetical protein DYB32_004168 [Aphanomyces invadans]